MNVKKWLEDNIVSTATLAFIVGAAVYWGGVKDLLFSNVEKKVKTEQMVDDIDPIKLYGEYIIDSIEEVQTQEWRKQQMIHDSIQDAKFNRLDSLLRLNIRINYETKKAVQTNE